MNNPLLKARKSSQHKARDSVGETLMSGQKYFAIIFIIRISLMSSETCKINTSLMKNPRKASAFLTNIAEGNCSFPLFELIYTSTFSTDEQNSTGMFSELPVQFSLFKTGPITCHLKSSRWRCFARVIIYWKDKETLFLIPGLPRFHYTTLKIVKEHNRYTRGKTPQIEPRHLTLKLCKKTLLILLTEAVPICISKFSYTSATSVATHMCVSFPKNKGFFKKKV